MVIRDFYFAAFLAEHGYSYKSLQGKIVVDITRSNYDKMLTEFKMSEVAKYRDRVKEISRLVNE